VKGQWTFAAFVQKCAKPVVKNVVSIKTNIARNAPVHATSVRKNAGIWQPLLHKSNPKIFHLSWL
jgi:hypothetical protein